MSDSFNNTESLLASVDVRGFVETLRLRWWVIPLVISLAVGFLWAQESDLRTQPGSYYVSRTYEARDSTAVLASVGIDPVSVKPFPDANNQLLILQSADVRAEIASKTGNDTSVSVTRSKPTFSLIETLESDAQSSFIFQGGGTPTYTFSCTAPLRNYCDVAIDAYVEKTSELRRRALSSGLEELRAVLTEVQTSSSDPSLAAKIAAIGVLEGRLSTPLLRIADYVEEQEPTITGVRRPTYTFGVAAGLLTSLLILLQLTYSDSRVRSVRQLARIVGAEAILGSIASSPNDMRDRRTALTLRHALNLASATSVRFLPVRDNLPDVSAITRIADMAMFQNEIAKSFVEIGIDTLAENVVGKVHVIVVQRNHDRRRDVAEAYAALHRSDPLLVGVVLLG